MKNIAISLIVASALFLSLNTVTLADGKQDLITKVESMHAAGATRDEMISEVKRAASAGEINQEQEQKFIARINEKMSS